MSVFDQVFFKVAPRDFAAFMFDTNDLSITRGGSLTLLAMPLALYAHLEETFPDYRFELIQGAASELFFSVLGLGESATEKLTIEAVKPAKPGGIKKWQFEKALETAVTAVIEKGVSDKNLLEAAEAFSNALKGKGGDNTRLAGMILVQLGNVAPASPGRPLTDGEAGSVEAEIRKFLRTEQADWPFDLFRFGVARFRPDAKNPDSARPDRIIAALETSLGLERMQALGCPAPHAPVGAGKAAGQVVCSYNRRLAADGALVKGRPASHSAERRNKVGRNGKRKRGVYERVLKHGADLADAFVGVGLAGEAVGLVEDAKQVIRDGQAALGELPEFANDFEQLVATPPAGLSLSAKSGLCLLRMDGNGFGKLRAEQGDLVRYRQLADYLDILKARLMAKILIWLGERSDLSVTVNAEGDKGKRTRFETLLWGGDEFAFVCPSWAGWDLARVIARETAAWVDLYGRALTFGTGVGFAHHKTPVAQFLEAVEALEDLAKRDRSVSSVLALTWEGVDRVHLDPTGYMARLYGAEDAGAALAFPAGELGQWSEWKQGLAQAVGRSALHRWVGIGRGMGEDQAWNRVTDEMSRIGTSAGKKVLKDLAASGRPFLRLQQLLYLHDYLEPPVDASSAQGAAA